MYEKAFDTFMKDTPLILILRIRFQHVGNNATLAHKFDLNIEEDFYMLLKKQS